MNSLASSDENFAGLTGEISRSLPSEVEAPWTPSFDKLYRDHQRLKQGQVKDHSQLTLAGARWPCVHYDFGDPNYRVRSRPSSAQWSRPNSAQRRPSTASGGLSGALPETDDAAQDEFFWDVLDEDFEAVAVDHNVSTFEFDDGRVRPISAKSPFGRTPRRRSVTQWSRQNQEMVVAAGVGRRNQVLPIDDNIPRFDSRERFYEHPCFLVDPVSIDFCFVALGQLLQKRRMPFPDGHWAQDETTRPFFLCWTKHYDDPGPRRYRKRLLCVAGSLVPQPLRHVRDLVRESVEEDPHGVPLRLRDLEQLQCSLLMVTSLEAALDWTDWTIGVHGIVISFEDYRGNVFSDVFLPSVAHDAGWDKEQTINCLIRKAGYNGYLDSDFRKKQVSLTRFTVAEISKTYQQHAKDCANSTFDFMSYLDEGQGDAERSLDDPETLSMVEATLGEGSVLTELTTPREEEGEEEKQLAVPQRTSRRFSLSFRQRRSSNDVQTQRMSAPAASGSRGEIPTSPVLRRSHPGPRRSSLMRFASQRAPTSPTREQTQLRLKDLKRRGRTDGNDAQGHEPQRRESTPLSSRRAAVAPAEPASAARLSVLGSTAPGLVPPPAWPVPRGAGDGNTPAADAPPRCGPARVPRVAQVTEGADEHIEGACRSGAA